MKIKNFLKYKKEKVVKRTRNSYETREKTELTLTLILIATLISIGTGVIYLIFNLF